LTPGVLRSHNTLSVISEMHMTTIELTEQQRQALLAESDKPIDVVDPGTQQHYVLIAQEQYERLRALLEQKVPQPPSL
jgi:hypothetical protein